MLPLALAPLLLSFAPAPETVLEGEHFALHLHFDAPELGQQSLELVEAVWPVAAGLFGEPSAPTEKLAVHLYRDAAAYAAAEAPLTNGEFARNLAFTHWDTKSAHVALQPDRKDELVTRLGLTYQTARLLTHEAAHLVRIHSCPNHASHPAWFANSVATWVDLQVLGARGWIADPMEDPHYASKGVRLQRALAAGELPTFTSVIAGTADEQTWQGTYDLHAWLFPFLETQGKRALLETICAGARQLGGGGGFSDALADVVFGQTKRKGAKLDAAFAKYLEKLEPQWEQLYASLHAAGDEWTHLAFPTKNAIAWRTAPVKRGKLKLTGELCILPGTSKQLNVLLDRGGDSFVQVSFVVGWGVTVFEFVPGKEPWKKRASAEAPLELGAFHAFEVATKGGVLTVELDGKELVELKLEREFEGPWGLGAHVGAAGIWRGIRAR